MRLTRLQCHRIHRRLSFDLELEPVTLIVGRNEAGKSCALGLPSLGVNGPSGAHWPVIGPSPDYDFFVELLFDDGVLIERGYSATKGHEAMWNGKAFSGLRQVQDRIRDHVGTAALFKLDDLVSLSPAKQLAWLEEEVLDGSWPLDVVQTRVQAIMDAQGVTDLGAFLQIEGFQWPRSRDGRRELADLRNKVAQADHEQDVIARRLKNVVEQDHEESQAGMAPGTVAEVHARLAAIQSEIEAAKEKRGELQGKDIGRREIEAQVANLHVELDKLRGQDLGADMTRIWGEIQASEAKLAESQRVTKEARAKVSDLESQLAPIEADLSVLLERGGELSGRVKALEVRAEELKPWTAFLIDVGELVAAAVHFESRLSEYNGDRDLVKRVRERIDPMMETIEGIALTKARDELSAARKDYAGRDQQAKALRRQLDAAKKTLDASVDLDRKLERRIAADMATHKSLQTKAADQNNRLAAIAKNMAELSESLAGIGDTATEAIESQLGALATEKEALEATLNVLQDQVNEQAARVENRIKLNDARDRREAIRAFQKQLEKLWRDLLDDLLRPLAEPVNMICRRVMEADWLGTSETGFTWGLTRKDVDLGPGSKSGNAVALAALRLAIVRRLKGWRHLIIDDLENLQRERRTALLECMLEQVAAGRLDNFLGAGMFDDTTWVPKGVKVIELPGGAET
jgi:hypothetical protein